MELQLLHLCLAQLLFSGPPFDLVIALLPLQEASTAVSYAALISVIRARLRVPPSYSADTRTHRPDCLRPLR